MVTQIYPTELQLNKTNPSDTEAPFLSIDLPITNTIVSTKNYNKWDNFNFEIVYFPFFDGDVPRSLSYCIYIFQLFRFARVLMTSTIEKMTSMLLRQVYGYHRLLNDFCKFYY